jgi:hypothetical protein
LSYHCENICVKAIKVYSYVSSYTLPNWELKGKRIFMAILKRFTRRMGDFVKKDKEVQPLSSDQLMESLLDQGRTDVVVDALVPMDSTGGEEAYTHGLEDIYAIEKIDLSTVVKMGSKAETEVSGLEGAKPFSDLAEKRPPPQHEDYGQLELDLGMPFRKWMESPVLEESIKALGLSEQAFHCLKDLEKWRVRDLLETDFEQADVLKAIGLGHIDEVKNKLQDFLKEKSLYRSRFIDFASLLRAFFAREETKSAHICVRSYELEALFELSAPAMREVSAFEGERKLDQEKRALQSMRLDRNRAWVESWMKDFTEVFLKPWIRARHGLVTINELWERVERVSMNPLVARKVIHFFADGILEKEEILSSQLIQLEPDLYAADSHAKEMYHAAMGKMMTYFYQPTIVYPLKDLEILLERELARKWEGYDEGYIEKLLRYSGRFRVRKGPDETLCCSLAND